MYEYYTPVDFIKWAEKKFDNDLDFTKYMVTYIKKDNVSLYDGVIEELKKNEYKIKFLDFMATS